MGALALLSTLLYVVLLALGVSGQNSQASYSDQKTGIAFHGYTWDSSGIRYGLTLPQTPSNDFVAQIVVPIKSSAGWGGLSLAGGMLNHLLITAWPNNNQVVASFRKANAYSSPPVWAGSAIMKPIKAGTYVNSTHMSYTFLCQSCITNDSLTFSASEQGSTPLAWAFSKDKPANPASASSTLPFHSGGYSTFQLNVGQARTANYARYAAMASA